MKHQQRYITAVVANEKGEIFDLAGYAAVGADGPVKAPLNAAQTLKLPYGSELMYLPDRVPLLYDLRRECVAPLGENPYNPGEAIYPVAAFNSPGYMITHTAAYEALSGAGFLPLFSYGAVGWHRGQFRSAAVRVDDEPRQDLRQMPLEKIQSGVNRMRRMLPDNRLRAHLEKCALTYGCPAGKNFFLSRYEAPLPSASTCNARCLGCLSLQPEGEVPSSQDRIAFTPTAKEIADVALTHILRVERSVVSFGQGCEGDPLLAADVICDAIRMIRAETPKGTINMNTNGSLPDKIDRLIDAGLDSLRISMNSVRKTCYAAYFRPRGYRFNDVADAIDRALDKGVHVAINYLNCPGFTDTQQECDALMDFVEAHPIKMIQWRNLNFDPLRYLAIMEKHNKNSKVIGVTSLLELVHRAWPDLRFGYFNPPKETFL